MKVALPKVSLKRTITLICDVLIGIIVLVVLFGSWYKLNDGWCAVETRFGKVKQVVKTSGVHFKLPWIDKVEKLNLSKIYKMEYGYKTVAEGSAGSEPQYDEQSPEIVKQRLVIVDARGNNSSIVNTEVVFRYKIVDPLKYLYRVEDLEGTMMLAFEGCVRNSFQNFTLSQALTEKASIDNEIRPQFQKKLDEYEAGIQIIEVKTQNTKLPTEVNQAYEEVEAANQYKNAKVQEAMEKKNTLVPLADGEYTRLVEEAKAYRANVIADAKADVAQYEALYEQYKANPNIVKEKYYIEAMKSFIKNNKLIIDMSNGNSVHKFYNMGDENNGSAVKDAVGGN